MKTQIVNTTIITATEQIQNLKTRLEVPYKISAVVVRKTKTGIYVRLNAAYELVFENRDLYFAFVLEAVTSNKFRFSASKLTVDSLGMKLEMFKVAEFCEVGFAKTYQDLKVGSTYLAKTKKWYGSQMLNTYFEVSVSENHEYFSVEDNLWNTAENPFIFEKLHPQYAQYGCMTRVGYLKDGIAALTSENVEEIKSNNPQFKFKKIGSGQVLYLHGVCGGRGFGANTYTNPLHQNINQVNLHAPTQEINATEYKINISADFIQFVAENHSGASLGAKADDRLGVGKAMHEVLELVEKSTGKCLNVMHTHKALPTAA